MLSNLCEVTQPLSEGAKGLVYSWDRGSKVLGQSLALL